MKIKKTKVIFLSIIFFGLFGWTENSWAACSWEGNTGTSANCTAAEINNCVSDASNKTGEVIINAPACSVTWSGNLTVDMTSGFANVAKLSILGAGTIPAGTTTGAAASGGSTINFGGSYYVDYTGALAKQFRLANFTFTGTAGGIYGGSTALLITGTSKPAAGGGWRFDHITFNQTGNCSMVMGYTYGVIDHAYRNAGGQVFSVTEGAGQDSQDSWSRDDYNGTSNAVFYEDNEIYCDANCSSPVMFSDGANGARIVYRHNKIRNHYIGWHDTLGNRGTFWTEIYGNEFTRTVAGGMSRDSFDLRGGSGVAYDNQIFCDSETAADCFDANFGNAGMHLTAYRTVCAAGNYGLFSELCSNSSSATKGCLGTGATWSDDPCTTEENCGGTTGVTNYCVYLDDPFGNGKGYPCRDQTGRSIDMELKPYLFWNNTVKLGTDAPVDAVPKADDCAADFIQNNRDFCYAETTMPSTCNGVNTAYASYTYPHPLQGVSDIVPPAAPSGLSVQ